MDDVVAILILLICLAIGLIIGVYFILRPKPEQTELEDGEILLESPKEKGEGFIGLPFIMIAVFFRALFEIFKFFFISPFINWAENIKEAKDEDKGKKSCQGYGWRAHQALCCPETAGRFPFLRRFSLAEGICR